MLGQAVLDPHAVEGSTPQLPGLGLLDLTTEMQPEKVTRQTDFIFEGAQCKGYEIHQGKTTYSVGNDKAGAEAETIVIGKHCIGTYMHGILDNPPVIDYILKPFTQKKNNGKQMNIEEFKDKQYDLLADHIRKYVDIDKILKIMES